MSNIACSWKHNGGTPLPRPRRLLGFDGGDAVGYSIVFHSFTVLTAIVENVPVSGAAVR